MAKKCEVCGKGADSGNRRSHSNSASKTRRQVNLQKKKIDGKTINICTACIKSRLKS